MRKLVLPILLVTALFITTTSKAQGSCPENAKLTVNTTNLGNGFESADVVVTWDQSNNGKKTLVIAVNGATTDVVDISKTDGEYRYPFLLFFQINGPARVSATIYSGGNEKKECWSDTWAHFIIDPHPPF